MALHCSLFYDQDSCSFFLTSLLALRFEEKDPRKCIEDGKAVTACTMDFFQRVKGACAAEFTQYAMCLERSSGKMEMWKCRKTQGVYDQCMKDKLDIDRPYYGYHSLTKIHQTSR